MQNNKLIKKAFLDTEDGQIFYKIGGEGKPLLLLPMIPRSSDEFTELMEILAAKYRVISMDLMGLGESDPPPKEYSMADYAKTIFLLLAELGIKKCNILGSLTGGYVAGEFAASYPEYMDKLILCNVIGFDAEAAAKVTQIYNQGYATKEDGSHLMEHWLARVNFVGAGELNHRCVLDALKVVGGSIYPGVAVGKYCVSAPKRFQSIQCPTLVCNGTQAAKILVSYGLLLDEEQTWLSQAIPHSQVVNMEEGNLWMMNQMATEIANQIIEFLD